MKDKKRLDWLLSFGRKTDFNTGYLFNIEVLFLGRKNESLRKAIDKSMKEDDYA
jgi:hypothetical protein